ncbi:hypothetical protein M0R45_004251 [Rubus argutus]|uniref:Uncharacterized protein n=1 Tax=Rubus argutus TaxID=59490 RepID=A0AAW1YJ77_RUBAR
MVAIDPSLTYLDDGFTSNWFGLDGVNLGPNGSSVYAIASNALFNMAVQLSLSSQSYKTVQLNLLPPPAMINLPVYTSHLAEDASSSTTPTPFQVYLRL